MKFNRPKPVVPKVEPWRILTPVKSSTLQAIGFYEAKEELVVEFKGGAQYLYKKVPKPTFDSLMNAESHGKFFHSTIKGKHEFVKIKQGIPKAKKTDE